MPRRTCREPQATSRPQPHPDCGRLSFAENRAPACEKGLGEGTLRQENPDSGLRRGIRASACGASADERFASIGPLGGGCRPARRPDAALPRLERQTTPAASRPREAATLRRTSAHRLSARTVPRRRIRSSPEPDSLTPGRGVRPFRAPSCRTFPPEIRRFAPRDGGLNRYILEFGIFSLYLHVERAIRFE